MDDYTDLLRRLQARRNLYAKSGAYWNTKICRECMEAIEELQGTVRHQRDILMQFGGETGIRQMMERIDRDAVLLKTTLEERDAALERLCEWCGVCPKEKRKPMECEIAGLGEEYNGDHHL